MGIIICINLRNSHNKPMGEDPLFPTHKGGPWGLESLGDSPKVRWGEVAQLEMGCRLAHPEAETWTMAPSWRRDGGVSCSLSELSSPCWEASDATWVFLSEEFHEPSSRPQITPPPPCPAFLKLCVTCSILQHLGLISLICRGSCVCGYKFTENSAGFEATQLTSLQYRMSCFYYMDFRRNLLMGKWEPLLEHSHICVHTHTESVKRQNAKLTNNTTGKETCRIYNWSVSHHIRLIVQSVKNKGII